MKAFICDRCDKTTRNQEHADYTVEIHEYGDDHICDYRADLCKTCHNDIVNLLKAKPAR